MNYDVRRNGELVARHETEEDAHKHAGILGEDFVVEPGRAFELFCEKGFLDSFHTVEEAEAAKGPLSKCFATFSVKEAALPTSAPEVEINIIDASEAETDPAPADPDLAVFAD